jgi:hypothetical protein
MKEKFVDGEAGNQKGVVFTEEESEDTSNLNANKMAV